MYYIRYAITKNAKDELTFDDDNFVLSTYNLEEIYYMKTVQQRVKYVQSSIERITFPL